MSSLGPSSTSGGSRPPSLYLVREEGLPTPLTQALRSYYEGGGLDGECHSSLLGYFRQTSVMWIVVCTGLHGSIGKGGLGRGQCWAIKVS